MSGVSEPQPLNILPRPEMAGEFVPEHYFSKLRRSELVKDERPLEVDLGCGDGSFLMEMAAHYPERDFLGVERLLGRVKRTTAPVWASTMPRAELSNQWSGACGGGSDSE